jgi:hypothetical protein
MRQLTKFFTIAFVLTSCTYERVFIGDVDKLTINMMESNQLEIDAIKGEVKDAKLADLKGNTSLTNKIDKLHKSILALSDSIEFFDKEIAAKKVIDFIAKNFKELTVYNRTPLDIDEETPRPLLKLHLATLEAFLQRDLRKNIQGKYMEFDSLKVIIVTTKAIIKKGEKITGELSLSLEPRAGEIKKMFSKMVINGQEIVADKDRLKFEIEPNIKSAGLVTYELNCEAFYRDPNVTHTVKGKQIVYIQQ